jgi:DNA-binding winged helix-turn-helix (wHTH) protein
VLQYLADRPRILVRKDELLNAVWGVEQGYEASLGKAIRELRLALDDNPDNPAFIETVHGRGFLFIAEIENETLPSQSPRSRGGISPDLSSLNDEDAIAQSDPADIQFTEYEILLSERWASFIRWLMKRTEQLEIISIQEDKNRESTFYCSGKPGRMNYPIEVSCTKAGSPVILRFDLVAEWLHPQVLGLRSDDAGVPWDTSLFPVGTEQEEESMIHDPQTTLRDARYWVLFARRR